MRTIAGYLFAFSVAFSSACQAQEWEVGAAGGFGFYRDVTISNPSGTAKAGFGPRFAAGVVIGQDRYRYVSGELRYTFRDGDLQVKSGGQQANLDGDAHALHYDLLVHARPRGSRFRPFVAGGAGMKLFRGTGKESAAQPLSDFALLTKTEEVKALISFGGGVKFAITPKALFRVDFRDYLSPFPKQVIVPTPPSKQSGWLHDFVPLVGFSYVF